MPQDWLGGLQNMLGLQLPQEDPNTPVPTELDIKNYYDDVKKRQEEMPLWKKIGQKSVEIPMSYLGGMFGSEPEEEKLGHLDQFDSSDWAKFAGNMGAAENFVPALAGLPYSKYIKDFPYKQIFHGAGTVFDRFWPSKNNDINDVLGWLQHGTPLPDYAGGYALGLYKGHKGPNPHIIPLHLGAENTLDLIDPNIDDMAQAVAQFPTGSSARERAKKQFRKARQFRERLAQARPGDSGEMAKDALNIKERHYPDPFTPEQVDNLPAIALAEHLRLDPEQLASSPFDAIRYRDVGKESWAWPETTPVYSSISGHDFTPIRDRELYPRFFAGPEGIEEMGKVSDDEINQMMRNFEKSAKPKLKSKPVDEDLMNFTIPTKPGVNKPTSTLYNPYESDPFHSKGGFLVNPGKITATPDEFVSGDFDKTNLNNVLAYFNEYNDDWPLLKEWFEQYHPNLEPWFNKFTGKMEAVEK